MRLAILKVILWPKDSSKQPREVNFQPDRINVITGQSGSGKSAMTAIIDYCLGSGKCAIPVGLIRDKTAWFGVLLDVGSTRLLVARPEPGQQQRTTDLYFMEGREVVVPATPEKNANIEALKDRLNQLAGLPDVGFGGQDSPSGFDSRPSIRDMAAFNFQPQHVVANPSTLFFKADTYQHREKLKTIFPLVLGAVNNEQLALQGELKLLTERLGKLKQELENRRANAEVWKSEAQGYYSRAQELGLLPDSPVADASWPLEKFISHLEEVPKFVSRFELPVVEQGASEKAVDELVALREREEEVSLEMSQRQAVLSRIRRLSFSVEGYSGELKEQSDRLQGIGWFESKIAGTLQCPLCGTAQDSASKELAKLKQVATEVSELSSKVESAPSVLDREIQRLRKEIRDLEDKLNSIRRQRAIVEDQSAEMTERRQTVTEVYRFAGRLEQALANLRAAGVDSKLSADIKGLEEEELKIRQKVDPHQEKSKTSAALNELSQGIKHYAKILKVERALDTARLSVNDLSLQILSEGNRRDWLWEIGSGANWMGYHVAVLLALHELFLSFKSSPVPSFLVFDQPSQVYFPDRWPEDAPKDGRQGGKSQPSPEDIEGVKRVFMALAEARRRTKSKLQIIVTDHAGEITWEGVEGVHLVETWRHSKDFLVPESWLSE